MRSQDIGGTAEVPYRRETFGMKQILLDFDSGFNLTEAAGIAGNANGKSERQLLHDLDSIRLYNDSVGLEFYQEAKTYILGVPLLNSRDSARFEKLEAKDLPQIDSIYEGLDDSRKLNVMKQATRQAQVAVNDVAMKADYAKWMGRQERTHLIEAIGKFTLALSCVIFFFIGAPLGAIIRKGGLGVPVIISVLVFIVYYIFENSGMRMARDGNWTIWFGKSISTAVLAPLAVFFTYKANRDSTVFNIDAYRELLMRMLGLRLKRNIVRKEVIIEDPKYLKDARTLENICKEIKEYSERHKLLLWPSPIKVFFHPGDDHDIEHINEVLEETIEDLSFSRDRVILHELNNFPIMATHAHTRPFRRKWMNIITGLILPLGIFFYIRMLRFRLRLYKDLRTIINTCDRVIPRAKELSVGQKDFNELLETK